MQKAYGMVYLGRVFGVILLVKIYMKRIPIHPGFVLGIIDLPVRRWSEAVCVQLFLFYYGSSNGWLVVVTIFTLEMI